jgi:hypothetical protein
MAKTVSIAGDAAALIHSPIVSERRSQRNSTVRVPLGRGMPSTLARQPDV